MATEVLENIEVQPMVTEIKEPTENGEISQERKRERRRKRGFDIGPGDLANGTVAGEGEPPEDDGSRGELTVGPGVGGIQPRWSECKRALPGLTLDQEERLKKAKRFAMEQSVQQVLLKQQLLQQQQMGSISSITQRQRALALMCRVYVGSINFELREEHIKQAFIPFGPIKKIDLSWDPLTMKHKGFAFVEFELPEAAQLALEQMNGVLLGGRNIKVGRPSNVPQAQPLIEQFEREAQQYARIYVASIHPDLGEDDIKSVFEAFGKVKTCTLSPDTITGKHKGFGFIEYEVQQSANDAIASMNLFDLGGQFLRVGRAITPPSHSSVAPNTLPAAAAMAAAAVSAKIQAQDTGIPGVSVASMSINASSVMTTVVSGAGLVALPTVVSSLAGVIPTASTAVMGAPAQGLLTSVTPISGMATVYGTAPMVHTTTQAVHEQAVAPVAAVVQPQLTVQAQALPTIAVPVATPAVVATAPVQSMIEVKNAKNDEEAQKKLSEYSNLSHEEHMSISGSNARYMVMQKLSRKSESTIMVLRNMVEIDDVDEELENEVTDECSKFGNVTRVVIYQEKQGEEDDAPVIVKIFVKFSTVPEVEVAVSNLNGRWFGGKTIRAEIYDDEKFEADDLTA
ncbi:poly(U)-binding-splicing factor PUF60-like isoform X2 [Dendronephthya gigantea]|uniref:poly(U)-binding-splicing factor PUF60-like isoform X2 n=1 Tax=Dendronephthya gigantea TaxID=151771 RepID=UPI00106DB287|nr:poly(U)-binding-splicing factor PUF60-like isoform X2 [Dendronephthya gigantea]